MLSLALPGTSWAHRLPAGAKFAALAALLIGAGFLRAPLPLAVALLAVAALYATLGRRGLAAGARALRPLLWIVGFIALWQLWQGTPREAAVLVLRILTMVALANFVTLTTPLPDLMALVERLARPLARFGLSPRLPALAVAMVLRFVPVLRGRMEMLALAWRARSRHRPGPRLIVPMTLSLLDDSEHLAEALRARGGLAPPAPQGENDLERNFALVVLFAALICALGFVPPITLASGVPISAQSLGVMLAGTVLGSRKGALAVLVVIGLVALGLPVLSGGRGGLGVFAGPTVGFLIGWVLAAFVAGLTVERIRGHLGATAALGAVLGGIVALYLCGTIGMMVILKKTFVEALLLSTPFIPGDLIKAAIAGWLTATIAKYRPGALLSRPL